MYKSRLNKTQPKEEYRPIIHTSDGIYTKDGELVGSDKSEEGVLSKPRAEREINPDCIHKAKKDKPINN